MLLLELPRGPLSQCYDLHKQNASRHDKHVFSFIYPDDVIYRFEEADLEDPVMRQSRFLNSLLDGGRSLAACTVRRAWMHEWAKFEAAFASCGGRESQAFYEDEMFNKL